MVETGVHVPYVYVTPYEVVELGVTVIDEVVCPPGDHKYVPGVWVTVAVKVELVPLQTVEEAGKETDGPVETVTVTFAVLVPQALVFEMVLLGNSSNIAKAHQPLKNHN